MSMAKVKVLEELLRNPDQPHYGYGLMRATGVKSGSLYPILDQFDASRWLVAKWELIDEQAAGRPPRRWYRLTDIGKAAAPAAIDAHRRRCGRKIEGVWAPGTAT
jgi:PadR family transcriptional regulator, regulatory protein PadR